MIAFYIFLKRVNLTTSVSIFITVIVGGNILVGKWWFFNRTKCPKCRKYFGRKILRSTYIIKESNGEIEGTIGMKYKSYTHYCICKYCNHEWVQDKN